MAWQFSIGFQYRHEGPYARRKSSSEVVATAACRRRAKTDSVITTGSSYYARGQDGNHRGKKDER